MSQNYKNHSQYLPVYHFILPVILLILTVAAVHHLYIACMYHENWHHAALLLSAVMVLWFIWFYSRAFALKAQDRVIMLEEKLRHQQLTGKPLPNLRPAQVIALRFASDAEFAALAEKAAQENLDSKTIKQSIQSWRADNYRV